MAWLTELLCQIVPIGADAIVPSWHNGLITKNRLN